MRSQKIPSGHLTYRIGDSCARVYVACDSVGIRTYA